jgi:hypothetical protein
MLSGLCCSLHFILALLPQREEIKRERERERERREKKQRSQKATDQSGLSDTAPSCAQLVTDRQAGSSCLTLC